MRVKRDVCRAHRGYTGKNFASAAHAPLDRSGIALTLRLSRARRCAQRFSSIEKRNRRDDWFERKRS
jgi:hypothetical protein